MNEFDEPIYIIESKKNPKENLEWWGKENEYDEYEILEKFFEYAVETRMYPRDFDEKVEKTFPYGFPLGYEHMVDIGEDDLDWLTLDLIERTWNVKIEKVPEE